MSLSNCITDDIKAWNKDSLGHNLVYIILLFYIFYLFSEIFTRIDEHTN